MKANRLSKKMLCLAISAVMTTAAAAPAFAADTVNITMEPPKAIAVYGDAVQRSYHGYLLLNATVSADGQKISYSVHEKYRSVLQQQIYAEAEDSFWGEEKPDNSTEVSDAQILKYLGQLTGDAEDGTAGTLRAFADELYRAIQDGNIDADAVSNDGIITGEKGYWLIADVTDVTEGDDANSLVVVDTKGNDELVVTPKVDVPTVEKKVQEKNDSTGEESGWQDGADYDIGDDVPFQLTGTLSKYLSSYETYTYIFHDTLSEGLDLNEDSVEVKIGDTLLTEGTDYVINQDPEDNCSFEISILDLKSIDGVTSNSKVVVTYTAELNEHAVVGQGGNPNEVKLEFSNDPYGDGTGETKEDKVTVFTFQLDVDKVDNAGAALTGAGFTLYKYDADADGEKWTPVGEELKGDTMTHFNWKGLDSGDYKLVETTVPAGYNKADDIEFTIEAEYDTEADDSQLKDLVVKDGNDKVISGEDGTFTATVSDGSIAADVVNTTGVELPETGGTGTKLLYLFGTILTVGAGILLIVKKRMSTLEKN